MATHDLTTHPACRAFLRGLAALPLIGNPTRAAEPVTSDLLDAYNEWLFYERRMLCLEQYGRKDAESAYASRSLSRDFRVRNSK